LRFSFLHSENCIGLTRKEKLLIIEPLAGTGALHENYLWSLLLLGDGGLRRVLHDLNS